LTQPFRESDNLSREKAMNFYFKLHNNYYCLDGFRPLQNDIWLERILFVDGNIEYTEDYRSISIPFCLGELIKAFGEMFAKSKRQGF
jgi:hypothetical protein